MKQTPTDDQYRAAARRLYARSNDVKVSHFAAILPLPGAGAFVEMSVWVPLEEAAKETDDEQAPA